MKLDFSKQDANNTIFFFDTLYSQIPFLYSFYVPWLFNEKLNEKWVKVLFLYYFVLKITQVLSVRYILWIHFFHFYKFFFKLIQFCFWINLCVILICFVKVLRYWKLIFIELYLSNYLCVILTVVIMLKQLWHNEITKIIA